LRRVTTVASGPRRGWPCFPEQAAERLGTAELRTDSAAAERETDGAEEEEERIRLLFGGGIWCNLGWGRAVGSDVAGVPGCDRTRLIFGLDMGGAGQPGRLRRV
jgi:hypothetical protein